MSVICPSCKNVVEGNQDNCHICGEFLWSDQIRGYDADEDDPQSDTIMDEAWDDDDDDVTGYGFFDDSGDSSSSFHEDVLESSPKRLRRGGGSRSGSQFGSSAQFGSQGNILRLERHEFRFAFWNIENLTGEVIRYGSRTQRLSLDNPRNVVRIEFIAATILALDLDAIAIMELGADGEQVLDLIVAALNRRDPAITWERTISLLAGPEVTPPDEFLLEFNPYKNPRAHISALEALLPYYGVVDFRQLRRDSNRRIFAHRWLLNRSDRDSDEDLSAILDELEDGDGPITTASLDQALRGYLANAQETPAIRDHKILHIFIGKLWDDAIERRERRRRVFQLALDKGLYYLVALMLVVSGATIKLERRAMDIDEEGPWRALMFFKCVTHRYERYGYIFRSLHEAYLLNELVETDIHQEGLPTNSRQAMSFNLPIGRGHSMPAFLIHSMFTPVGARMTAGEGRALRVDTLVAQAEHACGMERPPLFIIGDTNIDARDIDGANARMAARGYTRLGGAICTSLRTERTIVSARTEDGAFFSQPYDAVYQRSGDVGRFPTRVLYPFFTELQDLFLEQLGQEGPVREWYFGILHRRSVMIERRANPRRAALQGQLRRRAASDADVSDAENYAGDVLEAIEAAKNTARLDDDMDESEARLLALFDEFGRFENVSDDDVLADDAALEEDDDEDVLNLELAELVRSYLRLRSNRLRTFASFFRHFISDHRLVMMLMQYQFFRGRQPAARSSSGNAWHLLSDALSREGFRQGAASGRRLSCFFHSLLQLIQDAEYFPGDDNADHDQVAALRLAVAERGAAPRYGMIDAGDILLISWLEAHPTFRDYEIVIWGRNPAGALQERLTINAGAGTTLNVLLQGQHYTPLWWTGA